MYISGWKQLAVHLEKDKRTLQRWHYEIARLPFMKTHPESKYSRWVITADRVHVWLMNIGKNHQGISSKPSAGVEFADEVTVAS